LTAWIRRLRWGRAERATAGLAALAFATAGTVMVGEGLRMARRRGRDESSAEGTIETAAQAIGTAGRATQDAVTVAIEGYEAAPRQETALFNLLTGFVGGFALMRLSAYGQRAGWRPFRSVMLGGRHIHHFVPGILLAFGCGTAAMVTDSDSLETALAMPFGAGIGFTFDEAALLLDLRDVYWTREGILSVQLSLGLSAILGGTIIALRMLRRGERRVAEQGLIPPR
jgi:hypothetical protein